MTIQEVKENIFHDESGIYGKLVEMIPEIEQKLLGIVGSPDVTEDVRQYVLGCLKNLLHAIEAKDRIAIYDTLCVEILEIFELLEESKEDI